MAEATVRVRANQHRKTVWEWRRIPGLADAAHLDIAACNSLRQRVDPEQRDWVRATATVTDRVRPNAVPVGLDMEGDLAAAVGNLPEVGVLIRHALCPGESHAERVVSLSEEGMAIHLLGDRAALTTILAHAFGNLSAGQLPLGQSKIESAVCYVDKEANYSIEIVEKSDK